ncbi:hypothetical protein C8Q79DRAFT_736824 [Trametes meyenii]|nr:hypothetical protein C8Q79DRAFT_736824 [Trametes meyenii]
MNKGKNSPRGVANVEAGISFPGPAPTARQLNPIVPKIVIQSCDDDPASDSPASVYSADSSTSSTFSSVLDTPPPMTPTLASPIGFHFPTSPSFSAHDYLQVPPPSCHAPREEDKPVTRNVSNVSGQTFMLAAPPIARFSKVRKTLMERQMAANIGNSSQPQPQLVAQPSGLQVVRGCGVGPRVARDLTLGPIHRAQGVAGLGLGLALQPKLDFNTQARLADTSATSQPTREDRHCFSHANNISGDPDLANAFRHPPTTKVTASTTVAT